MRLVSLLFIILFSRQTNAIEPTCFQYFKNISKSAPKLLEALREKLDKILIKDSIELEDLKDLFERLKQEEEIFNTTYLNRSSNKRDLLDKEVQYLRKSFKLDNLTPQEIQDFYSNELYKLYLFVDHSINEYFAHLTLREQASSINDEKLIKTLVLSYQGIRDTSSLKEIGSNFTELIHKTRPLSKKETSLLVKVYELVNKDEIDGAHSLLQESEFKAQADSIIKSFESDKLGVNVCCKSQGGCYFCPNNLGLINKNAKKR